LNKLPHISPPETLQTIAAIGNVPQCGFLREHRPVKHPHVLHDAAAAGTNHFGLIGVADAIGAATK
jgi:hypothetical protein